MAQVLKGGPHGCFKIIAQLTGANGQSYGQIGDTAITNGTTSQAYVMDFPVSANITLPNRTTIDFTGGDVWQQSYQYGIASMQPFEFQLQNEDPTMTALCMGSLVNQTDNTQWTEYTENVLQPAAPQMSLIIIHRIQSFDKATFGQTKFVNTIIPRCWVAPKGVNGLNFQAKSATTFQVQPTSASVKVNGEAYSANIQAYANEVAWYHIISDYPLYMFVSQCNGSSLTAVGAYDPVSSGVGTTTNSKSRITKNHAGTVSVGVADTITPATGTFAVGSSLTVAAGDLISFLYETNFVPSS